MARITTLNRFTIVYVDDEAMARKYFELMFQDNYRIICADSANQALKLLDEHADEVALLITDQQMPRDKGIDLIRQVKIKHPQVTRMLTTAYANLDNAIESVNKGEIYRYVIKPWDIGELREHISAALHLYKARKEEQQLLAEKRQSIFKVASNIAHELRTPLAGIFATVDSIQEDFPELARVYLEQAGKVGGDATLSPERVQALCRAFGNIERQVQHSQAMITILLENIRDDSGRNFSVQPSMHACLEEALNTYPFFKQQRSLVSVQDGEDFAFRGNHNAMINIFHNLLKNSLYALQASKKTDTAIRISLQCSTEGNRVYFRDNGTGIPVLTLPFIFDDFFSSRGQSTDAPAYGNGIGLAFCKRSLNNWAADIECQSESGEFTEFLLRFPHVES
jgi:two-component system, response regulator PhcR